MLGKVMSSVALTLALALTSTPLWGQSPHFLSASDSIVTTVADGGDLVVSWKEAGLGNNVIINYTATASATASYACINGGGNHPSASNKETVNGPVSASGSFPSVKNGSITASLT